MGEGILLPLSLLVIFLAMICWTCWGAYWWMLRPIVRHLSGYDRRADD